MSCPHQLIAGSLDRWEEVHWQIHQIERNYHIPEGVRYSFNALIRAAKEIPQIVLMELQNRSDYHTSLKPILERLRADPLFSLLSKKRDFVVHRGMLEVLSKGSIGTTEGKGWKIGFPFPVHPTETSDEAYERFKQVCRADAEVRGLMGPDCDSRPMLRREWLLPDLPKQDFLEIAVSSWRTCGAVLSEIVIQFGGAPLDLQLTCRHEPEKVRTKVYSQEDFFRTVDGIDITTGKRIRNEN